LSEDEEWKPPGKKAKSGKSIRAASPDSTKNKSNRESFEEELESSQESQLKRGRRQEEEPDGSVLTPSCRV
jgi:hypothetical protein